MTAIYKAGLRLSIGTFRSWPADALYVETGVLPLQLLQKISSAAPEEPFLFYLESFNRARNSWPRYRHRQSSFFVIVLTFFPPTRLFPHSHLGFLARTSSESVSFPKFLT